jgi:small-conductance mechanosensitive channel
MKNWIVSKDALTLRIVEGVAGSVNPSKIQCQDVGTCESGVCTQGSASTLPINLGALLLAVLVALAL